MKDTPTLLEEITEQLTELEAVKESAKDVIFAYERDSVFSANLSTVLAIENLKELVSN